MPPPFGPGPGLLGALVTGAVVGGVVAASTRPPPPRYGYGPPPRGRYNQVIIVNSPPPGVPPAGPGEVLVLLTCPPGVGPGAMLEIEVHGKAYHVTVPPSVGPGQQFYARVRIQQPQTIQASVVSNNSQQPVYQATPSQSNQRVSNQSNSNSGTVYQATPVKANAEPTYPVAEVVTNSHAPIASATVEKDDPFATSNPFLDEPTPPKSSWIIQPFKAEYDKIFFSHGPSNGKLSPAQIKDALSTTGVPRATLRSIWELSDIDKDGMIDQDEFAVAMYLCRLANQGKPMPASLPHEMTPPSKMNPF